MRLGAVVAALFASHPGAPLARVEVSPASGAARVEPEPTLEASTSLAEEGAAAEEPAPAQVTVEVTVTGAADGQQQTTSQAVELSPDQLPAGDVGAYHGVKTAYTHQLSGDVGVHAVHSVTVSHPGPGAPAVQINLQPRVIPPRTLVPSSTRVESIPQALTSPLAEQQAPSAGGVATSGTDSKAKAQHEAPLGTSERDAPVDHTAVGSNGAESDEERDRNAAKRGGGLQDPLHEDAALHGGDGKAAGTTLGGSGDVQNSSPGLKAPGSNGEGDEERLRDEEHGSGAKVKTSGSGSGDAQTSPSLKASGAVEDEWGEDRTHPLAAPSTLGAPSKLDAGKGPDEGRVETAPGATQLGGELVTAPKPPGSGETVVAASETLGAAKKDLESADHDPDNRNELMDTPKGVTVAPEPPSEMVPYSCKLKFPAEFVGTLDKDKKVTGETLKLELEYDNDSDLWHHLAKGDVITTDLSTLVAGSADSEVTIEFQRAVWTEPIASPSKVLLCHKDNVDDCACTGFPPVREKCEAVGSSYVQCQAPCIWYPKPDKVEKALGFSVENFVLLKGKTRRPGADADELEEEDQTYLVHPDKVEVDDGAGATVTVNGIPNKSPANSWMDRKGKIVEVGYCPQTKKKDNLMNGDGSGECEGGEEPVQLTRKMAFRAMQTKEFALFLKDAILKATEFISAEEFGDVIFWELPPIGRHRAEYGFEFCVMAAKEAFESPGKLLPQYDHESIADPPIGEGKKGANYFLDKANVDPVYREHPTMPHNVLKAGLHVAEYTGVDMRDGHKNSKPTTSIVPVGNGFSHFKKFLLTADDDHIWELFNRVGFRTLHLAFNVFEDEDDGERDVYVNVHGEKIPWTYVRLDAMIGKAPMNYRYKLYDVHWLDKKDLIKGMQLTYYHHPQRVEEWLKSQTIGAKKYEDRLNEEANRAAEVCKPHGEMDSVEECNRKTAELQVLLTENSAATEAEKSAKCDPCKYWPAPVEPE